MPALRFHTDPLSTLKRATPDQLPRLLAAGYMEITELAGGFSCGRCRFAQPANAFCGNKAIQAPVSPTFGCCNLFLPREALVVFP